MIWTVEIDFFMQSTISPTELFDETKLLRLPSNKFSSMKISSAEALVSVSTTFSFSLGNSDAIVLDEFDFNYEVDKWNLDTVHVWRSRNPINGLEYGNGGIKLFPRKLTINMDTTTTDMTTSISDKFKAVQQVSNINAFNTDPFSTWKSAFRECVKLESKVINRQKSEETDERLKVWTTVGSDKPFGEYAIKGARAGVLFGAKGDNLHLINDFNWLREVFDATA